MEQAGGLKAINPTKRGFEAIRDMINSEGSVLSILTISSAKGFMIKLDVLKEHSDYFNIGINTTTRTTNGIFDTPVTSFILKFAVITDRPDVNLPKYMGRIKQSESIDTFFNEAKLQQKIWKKSILWGGEAICPSVANFCLFDYNDTLVLIPMLREKGDSENTNYLCDYLTDTLQTLPTNCGSPLIRTVGNADHSKFNDIWSNIKKNTRHSNDSTYRDLYCRSNIKIIP